jgi:HK97 family phage major capsid protein
VDNRLLYGLDFKEDSEILYGSGSPPAMNGILANANVETYLWSSGVTGDKKQDAIRRAMSLVFRAEYAPTGIVLNDADMVDIELSKDDQNGYMLGVMMAVQGLGERLWRLPVVVTNAIAPGTALVGAFRNATELWERQAGQIRVGDQDANNFTTNLLTVLAEKRLAQTIYRPEAFVEVSFDSAPA